MACMSTTDEFAKFGDKLRERIEQENVTGVKELWDEIEPQVLNEFTERCEWEHQLDAQHNYSRSFVMSVRSRIEQRSLHLAAEQVAERQANGEEISMEMNAVALMLAERDNNTPEYRRRLSLYEAACAVAEVRVD